MTFQLIPQAYAASWSEINADCTVGGVATIRGVECLFKNLISPVPALLTVVAVGMVILAGIRLLTAGADPKATAAAWNTFTWAIIGLILMAVAWIVIVLISRFTGNTDITTFGIPTP